MIKIFLISLLTIFTYNSYSQEITSAGKEFVFAYPPNYHTFVFNNDARVSKSDSLYVFIAAEEPTVGYVEVNDIYGASKTFNFNISDPSKVYVFAQSFWDYEMISYKFEVEYDRFHYSNGHPLRNTHHNEKVTKLSWKVVTDKDVNVTIQNQSLKSTDATLLFPVNSLGKNYIVASYITHNTFNAGDTPSQFVIVATEDNTNITIRPSVRTVQNGRAVQQIVLNAGETYLVQSDMDNGIDLTGTEINSDKNIAVFGSQMRARVPHNKSGQSRDFLIAQNLPTSVWGKSAFSIPFVQISQEVLTSLDLTRIIAGEDNTDVYINGILRRNLDKGEYFDIENDEAMYITSNKIISVVQYKKSQRSLDTETNIADPFMMINPPVEQFLDKYKIISPNTEEIVTNQFNNPVFTNGSPRKRIVFSEHYINVVIPDNFKNTLKINGAIAVNIDWNNVPTTNFSYAQIKVNQGTNVISADTTFGIYSYGYGDANSYGYVGGLGLKDIEEIKRGILLSSNPDCFEVTGSIVDTLNPNKKLDVVISEENNSNINFTTSFNQNQSLINYKASLIDKYQDGRMKLVIEDDLGNKIEKDIIIPGFTVSVNDTIAVNDIVKNIPNFRPYCTNYTIENYGGFEQTIDDFEFLGDVGLFTTNLTFPLTLNPGDKIDFEVCFDAIGRTGQHEISISLVSSCIKEERIKQMLFVGGDNKEPEISAIFDNCDRDIQLQVTELDDFDFGIKEVRLIDSVNITFNSTMFDSKDMTLNFKVIDPYKDSYISIEIEDSSGLVSSFERIIPGHTLEFGENRERTTNIQLGNVLKSSKNCFKIPIYNYGLYPITYENYRLINNDIFSVPLSQFPLTIYPNDSNYIEICMTSNDLGELELDTLFLEALCIETAIPMEGFIIRDIKEANSKCDLKVIIKEKVDFEGFGEVFPNPVSDKLNIEISSVFEGDLKYYILDNSGTIIDVNTIKIGQGLFILEIDVSNLINGNYTIVFEFETSRISRKFIVNK